MAISSPWPMARRIISSSGVSRGSSPRSMQSPGPLRLEQIRSFSRELVELLENIAEMDVHRLSRAVGIARRKRIENGGVFGDRFFVATRLQKQPAHALRLGAGRLHRLCDAAERQAAEQGGV